MIPWPVSQHALHDCRLCLADRRLDHASLFPFFDDQGVVSSLMLTTRDSSRISLIDWKPGLARKLPFVARQIDLLFSECVDADAEAADSLAELWHFDPWWELDNFRYGGHSAVPPLKRTNLPGFDESVKRVWFDPNLERVALMARGEGDGLGSVKRFTPGHLESAIATRQARRPPQSWHRPSLGQWRLRPFWE